MGNLQKNTNFAVAYYALHRDSLLESFQDYRIIFWKARLWCLNANWELFDFVFKFV